MGLLHLYIATSLDGKIAGLNHELNWLPEPEGDEDYGYSQLLNSIDTIVMGHATFKVVQAMGPWPYTNKQCYVFSRQPDLPAALPNITFVNQDLIPFVQQLKQENEGNIWLVGGGQLIAQLHDAGLIDLYEIAMVPHILGQGMNLFPDLNKSRALHLKHSEVYKDGMIKALYEAR